MQHAGKKEKRKANRTCPAGRENSNE